MTFPRLLVVVMLISLFATRFLATAEDDTFRAAASQENQAINPSVIHADQYVYRPGRYLPKTQVTVLQPDGNSSDVTCYAIRSYLVVRDSPYSDTTHRDGSTTCVPSARIHMYSAVEHGR